jgi:hypothetical protein
MPKYTKLLIADFDDTLVYTPSDTDLIEGVPARQYYDMWLADNGMPPRRFQGWWGRKETLLPPIFGKWDENNRLVPPQDRLNHELVKTVKEKQTDPDCISVLMTGRHIGMSHTYHGTKEHICKTILDAYGIYFDRYHYGSTGLPTLQFKLNTIQATLREFPSIRSVEIWEDRHPHTSEFWNFVKYYKRIGKLDEGVVHQIESPEALNNMPANA